MSVEDGIGGILGELGKEPTYAEIQRIGNKLLKFPVPPDLPVTRQIRMTLASSFTIDPLASALAVECHKIGLRPVIQVDGFNLYRSHILDPLSPLYKFVPDIVFLAAEVESITPFPDDGKIDERVVDDVCARLQEIIETFKRHSTALLVVHNFALPSRLPFSIVQDDYRLSIQAINAWLGDTYRSDSQVRVLDFEALCNYHGKCRVTNPKMHYLGSIEISESLLPVLTKKYLAYIKALKGLTRKCLVLDLDGTLWGGVVGDDGVHGIRLARYGPGSEYRDFQKAILMLYRRGVILAVNSKNNPDDALEVLRDHPDMVLREQHFASLRINWSDKASNLMSIAEELSIGLDSLVFVDDSPVERVWVRQVLPEVLVVDLPEDPAFYAQTLESLTDFEVLSLTDEDRQRGVLYASERARRELRDDAGNFVAFVTRLNMVLTVGVVQPKDIERVAQLIGKTNQFNMTTRRYTAAEIMRMASCPDALIYTLRERDMFGDSGLVGVVILKRLSEVWKIDLFLMSCRVLGRTIEQAFLTEVLADVRDRGISSVEAEFIPTAKNALASGFYKEIGFDLISENEGHTIWRFNVSGWTPQQPQWFTVEWEPQKDLWERRT